MIIEKSKIFSAMTFLLCFATKLFCRLNASPAFLICINRIKILQQCDWMAQITSKHFFCCFANRCDLFMDIHLAEKETFHCPSKIVQMIVSRLFWSGAFPLPHGYLNSTWMSAADPNFSTTSIFIPHSINFDQKNLAHLLRWDT